MTQPVIIVGAGVVGSLLGKFLKQKKIPTVFLSIKENSPDSIYVFEDLIYPVFEEKCIACHNKNQEYGGLNMSKYLSLIHI